jgi:basic membrane protein A
MVRRKLLLVPIALGALLALLAFTGSNVARSSTQQGDRNSASIHSGATTSVGMALTGPKNDQGYNQSYYDGLLDAQKKFNLKIQVLDNVNSPTAYSDALRTLAQNNEVVLGIGAEFAQPALTLAPQYPKVAFLIANGAMSNKVPNVYAYFVRQGVPAYPAGVIAARLTKTKKIGFIGGTAIPPTFASRDAFIAGAKSVNRSIRLSSAIVGDFYDASKSKQAASAQVAAGADVIYAFLDGNAVTAVVQAGKQAGKRIKIFQPIFSRCAEFKGVDVGYAYLSSTAQVNSMLNDFLKNTLPKHPIFYGMENPAIQTFKLCPSFSTPKFRALVAKTIRRINNGKIKLPKGV